MDVASHRIARCAGWLVARYLLVAVLLTCLTGNVCARALHWLGFVMQTPCASRAEFTPRNVQTAEERSRLVYRIKVSVDNSAGILKQGMPVDVTMVLQ